MKYSVAETDLSASLLSAFRMAESTGSWKDDTMGGIVGYADKAEIVAYDMLVRLILTAGVIVFNAHNITTTVLRLVSYTSANNLCLCGAAFEAGNLILSVGNRNETHRKTGHSLGIYPGRACYLQYV